MPNSRALSNLGIHVYGFAAVAIGIIGLVWGDFSTVWQPVPAGVPHRAALAYIVAVCLIAGGAAVQRRTTAQAGALVLAILYFMSALLWLPRVIGYPRMIGTWLGFAEEFALVCGGRHRVRISGATRKYMGGQNGSDGSFPFWPLRRCVRAGALSGAKGDHPLCP